jgi:uncharacterized protein
MTGPRFEPGPRAPGPLVQGLSAEGFAIDGIVRRAALLTPEEALDWAPPALADLAAEDFAPLLGLDPPIEFILLGTGPAMRFPSRALTGDLAERGFAIEAMDSRAAARTWGVLRGEGRWIGAALMPL